MRKRLPITIVVIFALILSACSTLPPKEICPSCKNELAGAYSFCPNCGFALSGTSHDHTSTPTTENSIGSSEPELPPSSEPTLPTPTIPSTATQPATTSPPHSVPTESTSAVVECTHKSSDWIIDQKPTCSTTGSQHKECVLCKKVLSTATIAAIGHNYINETVETPATCQSAGTIRVSCSNCSSYITKQYSLSAYSATEINNLAIEYVGEIITYNKQGVETSIATGFVYSNDGMVLTNYHVIADAYSAVITINGESFPITSVLAFDETIDLAVVKIDATNCKHATICTESVAVGRTVYAIGSSRGMTNTFSKGIVTYSNRVVDGVSHIQHDASITNGNSGGPLINEYGEVIGINTWKIEDSQNLNFAVSVAEINKLVFGPPTTLAELYAKNTSPYDILLDWLLANYNDAHEDSIYYDFVRGDFTYSLCYNTVDDYMAIEFFSSSSLSESAALIDLSCDPSEYGYAFMWDCQGDEYTVLGTLNAYAFNEEYTLTNYDYSGGAYISEEKIVSTARDALMVTVVSLSELLATNNIGVSITDFGFHSLF